MLQLADSEKRDIIKYLNKNKPLPEKYRFMLFDGAQEVELLWNGKTNEVTNTVLPFQTIEHIDEPRSEEKISAQKSLFDNSGRQIKGWTNKLIWGDNKLILSSLKNGPLRKEIEAQGGLKLIYIDPPFDVGADFSMDIKIGDPESDGASETFTKKPSVIEEIAYRDTWGKGADSFIAMIHERLKLMHSLLAEDGSIYVHCDWRVNSYMRLVLDEVFGKSNFLNEIIWKYEGPQSPSPIKFASKHDVILRYSKSINQNKANELYYFEEEKFDSKKYKIDENGKYFYTIPKGDYTDKSIKKLDEEGKIFWSKNGSARIKKFIELSEDKTKMLKSKKIPDIWKITSLGLAASSKENVDYPTQKPEKLLERIIKVSSNEGDLVADFFCGSGTTMAVAEKLGRKWIGTDLSRFSIHTTRKRMIGVQRELKKDSKDFRAFEILNMGIYERQHYVGENPDLKNDETFKKITQKQNEFLQLILTAYKAEPVKQMPPFHGKKRDRMVIVGPVDLPVTHSAVDDAVKCGKKLNITKIDILGFDYEMGIDFSKAKSQGMDLQFKVIPREVFDKRAVEKGQVKFYDVAYIEIKPIIQGRVNAKEIAVELSDFSVFYNQDNTGEVEEKLKSGGSKVVIENGQVIKISKDKESDIIEKEVLTKKWTDWVDYWSVDFDFESKKEIVRIQKEPSQQIKLDGSQDSKQLELDNFEKVWTGNYIFENEWQSFRTKKDRKLELTSAFKQVPKGKLKVAVKVVDIFGNDTTKVVEVNV